MSIKLRETKQYFAQYNTLTDTRAFIQREVALLDSINDNFTAAMSSASTKEQFLQQMVASATSIKV